MGGGSAVERPTKRRYEEEEGGKVVERVRVPGDMSCLFYSAGYLVENAEANVATQKRLRQIVYEQAEADPERAIRELYLERSIEEYREYILNELHEGGEQEIIALAQYYNVRFAIVSTQSLSILTYGQEGKAVGYLLYTGTHYDPLISASCQTRLWENVNDTFEEACLDLARKHNEDSLRFQQSEKIFRIRCSGCGAFLVDNQDFQRHCTEVEHDDDFAFDCEEVFHVTHTDRTDLAAAAAIAAQEAEHGPLAARTRTACDLRQRFMQTSA